MVGLRRKKVTNRRNFFLLLLLLSFKVVREELLVTLLHLVQNVRRFQGSKRGNLGVRPRETRASEGTPGTPPPPPPPTTPPSTLRHAFQRQDFQLWKTYDRNAPEHMQMAFSLPLNRAQLQLLFSVPGHSTLEPMKNDNKLCMIF